MPGVVINIDDTATPISAPKSTSPTRTPAAWAGVATVGVFILVLTYTIVFKYTIGYEQNKSSSAPLLSYAVFM